MFTNVTWGQFFGIFLLLSILYYLLILWLYFREEVKRLFQPAGTKAITFQNNLSEQVSAEKQAIPTTAEPLPQTIIATALASVQTDILQGIEAAKDAGVSKEQLTGLLKNVLQKYPELKTTTHQVQINEFLIQEAAKAAYVFQPFEVYALWPATADQKV